MDGGGPEAIYLQALRDGRFLFQRRADGRAVFPPRVAAPGDGGPLDWAESAGRGAVHSVTVQPQRPPDAPRIIALVDMDEGFRLLTRLEAELPIGARVAAVIEGAADIPHVRFVADGARA